jgi:hypothetical protein
MPRVLIVIQDGFAGYVCDKDEDLDIEVFDFDLYEQDPDNTYLPPPHFKDLCEIAGVPYVEIVQ